MWDSEKNKKLTIKVCQAKCFIIASTVEENRLEVENVMSVPK